MRFGLSTTAILISVYICVSIAACGGSNSGRESGSEDEVNLLLRNRTSGLLSHGYVHVHDTDTWIPILGTPGDDDGMEPLERRVVARVPYGVRFDVIAYGYDADRGAEAAWQSGESYTWGPFEAGLSTIRLGDR